MGVYVEYQPGSKFASRGAATADTPDSFQDCGKKIDSSEVVVDIDHLPKESIKALIRDLDIQTEVTWTDRGCHMHFLKPSNRLTSGEGICAAGFKVEILTSTNRPNGITVKRNGVLREVINAGRLEPLPEWLKIRKNDHLIDLTGLDEGDGRNEKLYRHKQMIRKAKIDDWPRLLSFINNYVFAKPLEGKEFATLARVDKVEGEADGNDVAEETIRLYKVSNWAGQLWFYEHETDKFVFDDQKLNRIVAGRCEKKRSSEVEEAVKWMRIVAPTYAKDNIFRIRLKNGFLDGGKFYPIVLDEFSPYTIPLKYNPDAQPVEIVDDYINNIIRAEGYTEQEHEDYKKRLLEIMAFGLIVDPEKTRELAKFHILRGEGANGKGTLLQIIKEIYGKENCSYLSIENMGEDSYLNQMVGKLMNLGDDIEDVPIKKKQFKLIKNITSADDITIRYLYHDATQALVQTKLLFSSNADIKTFDKGYALKRRMCWVPMFNTVKKPDPKFISKMTTPSALEYWLKLIVEAYFRLHDSGWTESKICEDYNSEYHLHNDLSLSFVKDHDPDEFEGKTRNEIEDMYNRWNTDDDRKFSLKGFKTNLWECYQMGFAKVKRNGEWQRLIMRQHDTKQSLKPTFK